MLTLESFQEVIPVPRAALRFPLPLPLPKGFRPQTPGSWPQVDGRLEFVDGRLWFRPPCGDEQQDVATEVTGLLWAWAKTQPGFVVGSNEAGMLLDREVRGAEAAIWLASQLPRRNSGGFRRVAPLLAVEVAGQDESESTLREKAAWYLAHGVKVVWLLLPATREVVVEQSGRRRRRFKGRERLPEHLDLPHLAPFASDFFRSPR